MLGSRPERWAQPTCTQEIGSRRHPKECGAPARFGLVDGDGSGVPIPMCEFHALLCMDRTGARVAETWDDPAR